MSFTKQKKTKIKENVIYSLLGAWCVYLDPHFIIGTLDFLPCLQASRLRLDDRWMLEAVMARSGIPPAVIVQVTTDASRPKWDLGMGSFGSPCFFAFPAGKAFFIKTEKYL